MSNGLIVEDIVVGDGKECVKGALILTHYRGTFADGTEFDSSHRRGQPFECVIGVRRVIAGWDQGLMGMKVGGKRKLFVPAQLGYGERSVNGIPPNSDLHFEIELLEVRTRDE
jgi:peptidylprolyl isomerase